MMQQREIIEMMLAARVEGISSYDNLDALAEKFPYCSTFQVLRAIGLKERDSIDFKTQLNRASISIQDRSKLYEYTLRPGVISQIEESQTIENEQNDEENAPLTAVTDEIPAVKIISTTDTTTTLALEPNDAKQGDSTEEVLPPDRMEGEGLFETQALEDEIMRKAISQLSDLEVETSMKEMAAEEVKEIKAGSELPKKSLEEENKSLSFSEWLLQKTGTKKEKKELDRDIIDKFIQENPTITPARVEFFSPSQMGKMSVMEDESFVTETLAKIYERQGDFKRAAKAYKNLGLKYPEKSLYFANLQKRAEGQIKS